MEKNVKIIAISDIHGYLPDIKEQADILCICGDIIPLQYQTSNLYSKNWIDMVFIPWAMKLNIKEIVFIGGNHDFYLENEYEKPGIYKLADNITYIYDDLLTLQINDKFVTIYGTPYIQELNYWAFYKNKDDLKELFGKIPDCDILITHQPPKVEDIGTVTQEGNYNYGRDFGNEELAEAIINKDIKYLLCGHIHTGNHNPILYNNTTLINCSLKDEAYNVFSTYRYFTL